MKRLDGYQCENCKQIHMTERAAIECENAHVMRMENAKVVGFFRNADETYGIDRHIARQIPQTIFIRFSKEYADNATYELVRVGPKGM
jgi:hypothetical protein